MIKILKTTIIQIYTVIINLQMHVNIQYCYLKCIKGKNYTCSHLKTKYVENHECKL